MKAPLVFAAVMAVAIAVGIDGSPAPRAQEPPATAEQERTTPLLTAPLDGVAGKEVNILHVSVPPGFATPKHVHPGQLFVYVVEGAVTIEVEGEAPIKLGPGDVVQEPPGKAMVGKNPSATHGAELVIFQIGEKGEPLTVEVE